MTKEKNKEKDNNECCCCSQEEGNSLISDDEWENLLLKLELDLRSQTFFFFSYLLCIKSLLHSETRKQLKCEEIPNIFKYLMHIYIFLNSTYNSLLKWLKHHMDYVHVPLHHTTCNDQQALYPKTRSEFLQLAGHVKSMAQKHILWVTSLFVYHIIGLITWWTISIVLHMIFLPLYLQKNT